MPIKSILSILSPICSPHFFTSLFFYFLFAARPGFEKPAGSSTKPNMEAIPTTEMGLLPADYVLEDPDSHFIYVCKKMDDTELSNATTYPPKAVVLW